MSAHADLPSWNDTPTRQSITGFVQAVADEHGPAFVPPAERVAVFDNDGILWSEKPIPVQLDFTLHRLAQLAEHDPTLAAREPYRAAVERDYQWLGQAVVKHYHGDETDVQILMQAVESAFAHQGVEEFSADAFRWLQSAAHPSLKRPYLSCGYLPMTELLRYLEANGFTTYIASGGDRDFMRPFAQQIYGIPPERVIGSALGLEFDDAAEDTRLVYKSHTEFLDDGPQKPVRIWSRTGRRPLLACGNANGDIPMLRFARTGEHAGLRLLILHDDSEREFAYTAGAEDALTRAQSHEWTVVSMSNDWARIYSDH
ncbi:MAG TPA: HAD family hydrolase [Actinocrinis sp.]